ncbi:hypothetical protein [Cytobacillus oceanisediminis]|uniref:hypothetical protein n=1 Tax=Cytobacillus oceanisediminis TaxID=665099 RepID=UPI0024944BBE|nr:hypothetical protein [Cytobacillus oceanisediminis]
MKKKRYILFVMAGILLVVVTGIFMSKPNEKDFVQWFEKEFDVNCLDTDFDCSSLEIGGKTYNHTDGYYDSSTGFWAMGMQIKRLYRNANDPNEFFSTEAKGFLGDFKETEFIQNKVDIR